MEPTRKQVIQRLVMMKSYAIGEDYEALEYAISSLKTDEAYQLMYEGGEIYTKADMVAILRETQMEIEEIEIDLPFGFEPVTKTEAFYQGVSASEKVIQEKINLLKEIEDDKYEPHESVK